MQSADAVNEKDGLVRHRDLTDITRDQGVTISETIVDGANRIITESVGDQVLNICSTKLALYNFIFIKPYIISYLYQWFSYYTINV